LGERARDRPTRDHAKASALINALPLLQTLEKMPQIRNDAATIFIWI
jgi:hypothetical protein